MSSAGHLPGAVNVPAEQTHALARRFDKQTEIVAYCRGPYCVLSFEAVAQLRARGFNARRLEDGFPNGGPPASPSRHNATRAAQRSPRSCARQHCGR